MAKRGDGFAEPARTQKAVSTAALASAAAETFAKESVAAASADTEFRPLPGLEDLEAIPLAWKERYPEAVAVDSRVAVTATGSVRWQTLLSREGERISWVLWEEKIVRAENGAFVSAGSIAHMGNVILVDASPDLVPAEALEAFSRENGLFVERRSVVADYVCLGFEEPELGKIEGLLAAFETRFPGAIAEFDTLSFPSATPSDWDASRMWGLDMIHAEDAWQFEKGNARNEVVIAIIDTGAQRSHPDLAANLFRNPREIPGNGIDDDGNGLKDDLNGWDFFDQDSDPQDDDGHGTHVAGIAGAVGNNGRGAVGVNWGVRILPLRVGDAMGLRTSSIDDALAYVRFLRDPNGDGNTSDGINIVATNNSYGSGGSNSSTRREISKHRDLGVLFVAAAGNDGKNIDASADSLEFPAGYDLDNIISVGNSNQEDTLSASSNYGRVSVDISAPGSDIYSTYPTNSYEFLSGTSMASPMVAGAVGLLAQFSPNLSANQLKKRILDTGDVVASQAGRSVTGRRLNLLAALKPELSGHFLEVSNVDDAIVLVDAAGPEVVFEVAALPTATLSVEVVSGSEVGEIIDLGGGVFRFATKASGQATLRFSANLEGVTRFEDKTVVVGESAAVSQGLLHHFAFDGTGSVETDLAGGSNASIAGATRVGSDFGSSLRFDSASEKMTFNGSYSNLVTIAALVRVDDLGASPHPRVVNMPFYYLYVSSGDSLIYPDGNRQTLKFLANYSGFGVWNTPPRSVMNGQWYYFVGTYDSTDISNTPRLYINGETQKVRLQQPPEGAMIKTGGLTYVGNSEVGDRAFEGLMADIRIYDRALGAEEIAQLGAILMRDRWEGMAIDFPDSIFRDEAVSFRIVGSNQSGAGLSARWYFEAGADAEVLSRNATSATLSFVSEGEYLVSAQVSDGVSTRVIQRTVKVLDGRLSEGHYLGNASNGAQAWLEVEPSLKTGYVTVFDGESGFYRIREAVTFGAEGTFESSETGLGRLSGVALRKFVLEVPGYGLEFLGERQAIPSAQYEFVGSYEGGALGLPGDSMRLKILKDGRCFLWREGPFADLAYGSYNIDGSLSLLSSLGRTVEISIDSASESARGRWGDCELFLTLESVASDALMKGGVAGGYPSGSAAGGLYAEFLEPEVGAIASLGEGGFSGSLAPISSSGPFVLLGAKGESIVIEGDTSGAAIADSVAKAVASGGLHLDTKVLSGIRSQAPVSGSGSGLVGFSVVGSEPLEILVRGLGPSFSESGVEDPKIVVYRLLDGVAIPLEPNDNWRDGALFLGENESQQGAFLGLESGFEALELSALSDDAKDAAQRVWLEPGDYLVLIQLANGSAGSGLIEVLAL